MRAFVRKKAKRFSEFWWGDTGLSMFLLLLFLLFFISPFLESRLADILLSTFLVLLLISGILSVTDNKPLRIVAFVVAGSAMVLDILRQIIPSTALNGWRLFFAAAFFFLLIYVLLSQVFRDGPVTAHRIRGAIAVYVLIGITWALIYRLIELVIPGAFSFPQSLAAHPDEHAYQSSLTYFSFVTMTTLGYGDILPVSPLARVLVIFEALIGQLYPATLLARLVSLEIASRQGSQPGAERKPGGA